MTPTEKTDLGYAIAPRGAFLTRLFRVSRSSRNRLEDFLTEFFAELLRPLSRQELLHFLSDFFVIEDPSIRKRWFQVASKYHNVTIQTQVQIAVPKAGTKRPDIVIFGDQKPLALIECKIGAGFTWSRGTDDGPDDVGIEQLEAYGKWLKKHGGEDCLLALLTQYADPPFGFEHAAKYGVKARAVRRWSELHSYVRNRPLSNSPHQRALTNYFCDFAKESQLMEDDVRLSDFAAANLYAGMQSHWRLIACVQEASNEIRPMLKKKGFKTFQLSGPKLWRWQADEEVSTWMSDSARNAAFEFNWGFFWNSEYKSENWQQYDPPWTLIEGIGVYVSPEKKGHPGFKRPSNSTFKDWTFSKTTAVDKDPCAYKVRSYSDLASDKDASKRIATWLVQAVKEGTKLL